jgi:hypothetical protein
MVSEFERRAWESRTDASEHTPQTALKMALDDIENGKHPAKHVIVIMVDATPDGGDYIHCYQAGSLSEIAAEGAVHRTLGFMSCKHD